MTALNVLEAQLKPLVARQRPRAIDAVKAIMGQF